MICNDFSTQAAMETRGSSENTIDCLEMRRAYFIFLYFSKYREIRHHSGILWFNEVN